MSQEWNDNILKVRAVDNVIDGIGEAFESACEEMAPIFIPVWVLLLALVLEEEVEVMLKEC